MYNAHCIHHKNERGLEQNSGIIIIHVLDPIINPSSVGKIFFKKSINNVAVKLYNNVKYLENIQLFKKKLNLFLLQQTYSVDECLLYDYLSWKM